MASSLLTGLIQSHTMDESSGSSRVDSGPNGYDLVEDVAIASAAGLIGNAADFDTTGRLKKSFETEYNLSATDFSFSCLVYFDTKPTSRIAVLGNGSGITVGNTCFDIVLLTTDTIHFRVSDGITRTDVTQQISGDIPTGEWIFIACRWDDVSEDMEIRLNDQAWTINSAIGHGIQNLTDQSLNIGDSPGDNDGMDGRVDELHFWNKKITDAEADQLYRNHKALAYPFPQFPSGFTVKGLVTVNNSQVEKTTTKFPVLLTRENFLEKLMDAGSESVSSGGAELRFSSDLAGATEIPFDVVEFVPHATAGSRNITVWVQAPDINSGVDKEFYVWTKNSDAVVPAPNDVTIGPKVCWTGATGSFKGVYHLNTNYVYGDEKTDSSGVAGDMAVTGTPSIVDGPWAGGRALDFNGTSEYLKLADPATALKFTTLCNISGWGKTNDISPEQKFIGRQHGTGVADSYGLGIYTTKPNFSAKAGNITGSTVVTVSTWHHMQGAKNDTTSEIITLDGQQDGIDSSPGSPLSNDDNDVFIGAIDDGNPSIVEFWDGPVSTVLFDQDARDNDYRETLYNTMADPTNFITMTLIAQSGIKPNLRGDLHGRLLGGFQ